MKRTKRKGLVYLRRSTDKQETGIHEQLRWAIAEAQRHEVQLDAAPEDLEYMLVRELAQYKGIYLDDGISGSKLDRPGCVAFRQVAMGDSAVSHVFVHLSDRFARPEQAHQAMQQEIELLLAGITVVFSNRISEPRKRGQDSFPENIQLLYEYSQNGEFLNKLATRVLQSQRRLAEGGCWNGGPPPYGFCRVLVDAQGNELRELQEGETVKREGCHVKIKPKDSEKIRTWLRILHLHGEEKWGHKRIANHLNDLGIPSPNAGRVSRRNGIQQPVSGRWWPEAVKRLIENAAIIGMSTYGKTSCGEHRRFSPQGPRTLEPSDRRDDDQVKRCRNDPQQAIVVPTGYESSVDPDLFEKCQQLTEQRGKSQRGIPRSRDLTRYPLSSRICDLTDDCGAVLFGRKENDRLKYECSRYRQSGGRECHRHVVDAEASLRFVLHFLRTKLGAAGGREALRAKIEKLAEAEINRRPIAEEEELRFAERRLYTLQSDLEVIGRNMALAGTEAVFKAVEEQFHAKQAEAEKAQAYLEQLAASRNRVDSETSLDQQIEAAMTLCDDIDRITCEPEARSEIAGIIRKLNLRMWLTFRANPRGKRPLRILQGGLITTGLAELPQPTKHRDGDHPPDADDSDDGPKSVVADNAMSTVTRKPRHQGARSFSKETVGKPPVAPGG